MEKRKWLEVVLDASFEVAWSGGCRPGGKVPLRKASNRSDHCQQAENNISLLLLLIEIGYAS